MGPACAVMVELPLSSGRQQQRASATGHGLGDTALRGSPVVLLPHGFHVFGGFMALRTQRMAVLASLRGQWKDWAEASSEMHKPSGKLPQF